MSSLVSILGTKLINLMTIKTVKDTDYLIIQKDTNGDQFTRKILWADIVSILDAAINPTELVINNVSSPYTITDADSATFLVFDDPATATVSIPEGVSIGSNFAYTNKGAGSVQLSFVGAGVLRGVALLGVPSGYAAATKLDTDLWQTSER